MYKVNDLKINGYWGRGEVYCNFHDDVNVIIGHNGTGKSTLMNILNSVLTCEFSALF